MITQTGFGRLNLPPEQRVAFRWQLLDRIKAIPGVEAAADARIVPLSGDATDNKTWLEGAADQKMDTNITWVGPGYFGTLRTPLLAGRDFDERDSDNAPKVAVVNETFARKLLNGANPVGHRFRVEATPNDPETGYDLLSVDPNPAHTVLRWADGSELQDFVRSVPLHPERATRRVKRSEDRA